MIITYRHHLLYNNQWLLYTFSTYKLYKTAQILEVIFKDLLFIVLLVPNSANLARWLFGAAFCNTQETAGSGHYCGHV